MQNGNGGQDEHDDAENKQPIARLRIVRIFSSGESCVEIGKTEHNRQQGEKKYRKSQYS